MEKYSHKQKVDYYAKRASDTSLKLSQRQFAQGFINGATDTPYAYKNDTVEFMKTEVPRIETANKAFVSPKYNGYGQGSLSALKDLIARRDKL